MLVILLSLSSAALFGAMTVALRLGLGFRRDAELGTLVTMTFALAVATVAVVVELARNGAGGADGLWPFALAGLIAPGGSQLLFTLAVREVGASRTSVVVGAAPLIAVTIALTVLDEPVEAGLVAGAVLVVAGGIVLARERARPQHLRILGLFFALAAAGLFASRDNLVRWLAIDTGVSPLLAVSVTMAAGLVPVLLYLGLTRRNVSLADLTAAVPPFAPAGILYGISYILLFEAYYRGRVSIVSPAVATESLWGVLFAVLFLRQSELVGRRVVVGALLVVAGGALIGVFR